MTSPITLVGNLTADAELKFVSSGAAVCNFTVAVQERVKQGDEWVDGETSFYNCAAWRTLGEHLAESLLKGMRVIVVGGVKIRSYEKNDGTKGQSVDVTVEHCGPELRFATATVSRAGRGAGPQAAPYQPQQTQPQPSQPAANDPWAVPATSDSAPPF